VELQAEKHAARRGSLSWIGQAVSGVLLLGLVGIHMIGHHYIVEGGLRNYNQVLEWLARPFITGVEILFLIVVTYHALAGVRAIIFDLELNRTQQQRVTAALVIVGLLTIGYGLWLAVQLSRLG